MKASQLRDLTRKYAAGGLSRDDYVAERTRLLDGIASGSIEIRYRELDPAAKPAARLSQKKWWIVGGTLMLVGLLMIALLSYFLGDGSRSRESTQQPARSVGAAADPGAELVRKFVQDSQWSEGSLQAFEAEWRKLTPFQQESARRSPSWRQLRHETTRRVIEQEALLATGEMDALLVAGRLRAFAEHLGFTAE